MRDYILDKCHKKRSRRLKWRRVLWSIRSFFMELLMLIASLFLIVMMIRIMFNVFPVLTR